jgi:hypothetical protein
LDPKNGLFLLQPLSKTQPAGSLIAKPGPVPVNLRVPPGFAIPVGSNILFRVSGFTFMVAFRYATVNLKILKLVHHGSFSTYQQPGCANQEYSRAQPYHENELQLSVKDFWSCVQGNVTSDWV